MVAVSAARCRRVTAAVDGGRVTAVCPFKRPMHRHSSNDNRSNSDSSQVMNRRLRSAPRSSVCEDTHEQDRQALCKLSSKNQDVREAAKLRKRKSRLNMTPERHESTKSKNRVGNMTPERHESIKSRHRVGNMSPDAHETIKSKNRVGNMSAGRHEATKSRDRARDSVTNMSPQRLRTKRARDQRRFERSNSSDADSGFKRSELGFSMRTIFLCASTLSDSSSRCEYSHRRSVFSECEKWTMAKSDIPDTLQQRLNTIKDRISKHHVRR